MDAIGLVKVVAPAALFAVAARLFLFTKGKDEDRSRQTWRGVFFILAGGLLMAGQPLMAGLAAAAGLSTFKRTVWRYLTHPAEFQALIQFKFFHAVPGVPKGLNVAQQYCYEKLQHVSRSFAAVILHLHAEIREPICVFYLVCRGIDTVEDDMKPPVEAKVAELNTFYKHLGEKGWTLKGFGDAPHEIDLLEKFDRVNEVYATFKPAYKAAISDIAERMGKGMASFLTRRVTTLEEYDEYCYYVAGLVGEGLSRLFVASGLEGEQLVSKEGTRLSVAMGLFLQKTNIIRDYLEDIEAVNSRMFYPKAIWGKHAARLEDLKLPQHRPAALRVLNEMVCNALQHAEDCLTYLSLLKEPTVFNFCAIPQTMAMATLALCLANGRVFEGEVKIGKGEAVSLMLSSGSLPQVARHFRHYAALMARDVPHDDPAAPALRATLQRITAACRPLTA